MPCKLIRAMQLNLKIVQFHVLTVYLALRAIKHIFLQKNLDNSNLREQNIYGNREETNTNRAGHNNNLNWPSQKGTYNFLKIYSR